MTRRCFLKIGFASAALSSGKSNSTRQSIVTVTGPIRPRNLGITLPHEHILVDFIGADKVSRNRYDSSEVFESVLPHLKNVHMLGCRTLVECTPAYLGRDPGLLQRLARASGMNILTNTGLYGAADDRFVPAFAFQETADQLARRWTAEWREGIEGTEIRPGFMKIGVDPGPLSEIDAKLVRAAARCHLQTGLTIAAHTGNGVAAMNELRILQEEGVGAEAFIWVHAQTEPDRSLHVLAAKQGAWVEFDGINADSVDKHVQLVIAMKESKLLRNVLVSHDAGWYNVGEPDGGTFRPYDVLFTRFLPALKRAGLNATEVNQLIVDNPRRAFVIRLRRSIPGRT